jgi:hypothetical protein
MQLKKRGSTILVRLMTVRAIFARPYPPPHAPHCALAVGRPQARPAAAVPSSPALAAA